jgi:hypothetical protein
MSVPELQFPPSNKTSTDPLWEVVRFFSGGSDFHPEDGFDRMLYLERKRTERSRRPFMLLLLNVEDLMPGSDWPTRWRTRISATSRKPRRSGPG